MSIRRLDEVVDADAGVLGGKGWNLALLVRAGLPVPDAFCLSCDAYRRASAENPQAPTVNDALRAELVAAYHRLGRGRVAVRSSATFEDGAAASFAGLQETVLGVEGEDALVAAVERCWRSLDSERARLYRAQGGIDERLVAMGVVVQRLVEADVAGVLFTVDPLDPTGQQMLVEASWGLGEAVVSGRVNPDRFQVDRRSGQLVSQQLGHKTVMITATGERPVEPQLQDAACLDAGTLAQLAELARRVETYYGEPRDIEWALAAGRCWLLQARPITAATAAERARFRAAELARLSHLADPQGTVWARYNLSEVLPTPTPMSWAIVGRLMSGRGGLGQMFRRLGFDPDRSLDELGFIDLVCGRPFVNLSREARMHFAGFPYGHDLAALKAHPEAALYPQPRPDPALVTFGLVLRLPMYLWRMQRAARRMERQSGVLASRLRSEVFPRFAAAARTALAEDLATVSDGELLARFDDWQRRTLEEFPSESLQSGPLAAAALARLEQALTPALGAEQAREQTRRLLSGAEPDRDADLFGACQRLARGEIGLAEFLAGFGHRGPREMELAEPRWSECPEKLATLAGGDKLATDAVAADSSDAVWSSLVDRAGWSPKQAAAHSQQRERLRTYMGLREAGKHYLMLGYAVLRRLLVELARRRGIGEGIFYLEPGELSRLVAGEDLSLQIAERRRQRAVALSFEVPLVLFSDDLEAIGRSQPVVASAELQGTPVSAGVSEGPALVLDSPEGAPAGEGFILVAPSTDPAWVPLFLRARGLVLESGGILSHGAIVAREFGLPAVVGIDQVTRRLRTGDRLRVDGNTGQVLVLERDGGG